MRKLKKYLLTGLSLGLIGFSVGTIAVSCAYDFNPATGTLTTEVDQPLNEQQMIFMKKQSSEISAALDEDIKLKENRIDNKFRIEWNIKTYKQQITASPLDYVIRQNGSSGSLLESSTVIGLFEGFKQKNLLPSKEDILSNTDREKFGKQFAIFYSDPKDIILLYWNITLLSNNIRANVNDEDRFYLDFFDSVYIAASLFKSKTTPAYQAWLFYKPIFDNVKAAISEINKLVS